MEDAVVFAADGGYDGEQMVLRVEAPKCAARAEPGSFVHLTCDPSIPMRRPLSIMRADAEKGWVRWSFYKVLGPGLQALAARKVSKKMGAAGADRATVYAGAAWSARVRF